MGCQSSVARRAAMRAQTRRAHSKNKIYSHRHSDVDVRFGEERQALATPS
jgi:hypothetical protein